MNERDIVDLGLVGIGRFARRSWWADALLVVLIFGIGSWVVPTSLFAWAVLIWLMPELSVYLTVSIATVIGGIVLGGLFWLST
jgi:hypothetical protein